MFIDQARIIIISAVDISIVPSEPIGSIRWTADTRDYCRRKSAVLIDFY